MDNMGWLTYAYATALIPIAIANAVSESYIIVAAILGVVINREKLKPHQYMGIGVALAGVLILTVLGK